MWGMIRNVNYHNQFSHPYYTVITFLMWGYSISGTKIFNIKIEQASNYRCAGVDNSQVKLRCRHPNPRAAVTATTCQYSQRSREVTCLPRKAHGFTLILRSKLFNVSKLGYVRDENLSYGITALRVFPRQRKLRMLSRETMQIIKWSMIRI